MQSTPKQRFQFSPVRKQDKSLIPKWLEQDYIRQWIHGQGLDNTLNGLEKFVQYYGKTQQIDRQSNITQHWIGYDEGKPFVYLLTSNILKDEESDYANHRLSDGYAITLDIFIVDKSYLGKGLACQIIKEFLLSQFSDIAEVFIDPEQTNTRAVHVYQKVGFKVVGEFIASWHPVPHYLMRLDMNHIMTKSLSH